MTDHTEPKQFRADRLMRRIEFVSLEQYGPDGDFYLSFSRVISGVDHTIKVRVGEGTGPLGPFGYEIGKLLERCT